MTPVLNVSFLALGPSFEEDVTKYYGQLLILGYLFDTRSIPSGIRQPVQLSRCRS
jgi:hypothetical protein